jgi:hypothetical protein
VRDAQTVLSAALSREDTRPAAIAFVIANLDRLIERYPAQSRANLVGALTASCDETTAPAMRELAEAKLAKLPGGRRRIDQSFERLAQCVARRAAVTPPLVAWLKKLK